MVNSFQKDIQDVIDAAQRLNVELDETEAVEWLEAIQKAKESDDDIAFCERTGVFGQNVLCWISAPSGWIISAKLATWLSSMMSPAG